MPPSSIHLLHASVHTAPFQVTLASISHAAALATAQEIAVDLVCAIFPEDEAYVAKEPVSGLGGPLAPWPPLTCRHCLSETRTLSDASLADGSCPSASSSQATCRYGVALLL